MENKSQMKELEIKGCYHIKPAVFRDERGEFVKLVTEGMFKGIEFKEEFYSISKKNVLRGMHFQLPPHAYRKLVHCISGKILDVIVDLRKGSPTFKKHLSFELNGKAHDALFLPKGIAHGYLSLEDNSIVGYKVDVKHVPDHDTGILWSSIGFDWPVKEPTISDRDKTFKELSNYEGPFTFERHEELI